MTFVPEASRSRIIYLSRCVVGGGWLVEGEGEEEEEEEARAARVVGKRGSGSVVNM